MKISKELIKGSTAMLVLSVVSKREMYGYQIIKELEVMSDGTFSMNEGTLYPILHAFETEKFLESYWEDTDSARKRKYYKITDKGIKELQRRKEEWTEYSYAVNKVIGRSFNYV